MNRSLVRSAARRYRARVARNRKLLFEHFESRRMLAISTWTGNGADDLWSNAANWDAIPVDGSDVRIPSTAASDEVVFDASVLGTGVSINSLTSDGANPIGEPLRITGDTLTLNGAGQFRIGAPFTLADGILSGSGDVTISGPFTWSGGTLSGSGVATVTAAATFDISTASIKTLSQRTLVNNTTANFSGGNTARLNMDSGALLDNNGVFNAIDGPDIGYGGGSAPTFQNDGTFNNTGPSISIIASIDTSIPFNNTGIVNVDSGKLQIAGGGTSSGGTFGVDAGAVLELRSYTLNAPTILTGAGAVLFNGGTSNINGTYTITGGTTIEASVVANFNTTTTLTTLSLPEPWVAAVP